MFRLLLSAVFLIALGSLPASAFTREPKADAKINSKKEEAKKGILDHIKWETMEFEKVIETELSLKMKSFTVVEGVANPNNPQDKAKRVKFLLEFTKDVDAEAINYFVPAFSSNGKQPPPVSRLEFLFFDVENVRIGIIGGTNSNAFVDGAITGKTGEAFRVFAAIASDEVLARTKRVEVRLHLAKKSGKTK